MPSKPSLSSVSILIATWFGAGYLPKAPGTWGSLFCLPFAWVFFVAGGEFALILAACGAFFIGLWASHKFSMKTGMDDAPAIVIDEVAGQWLVLGVSFTFISASIIWSIIAFSAFRMFDILKPWPINLLEKKIRGSLGVMLDDIGAAIYAIIFLLGLHMLTSIFGAIL